MRPPKAQAKVTRVERLADEKAGDLLPDQRVLAFRAELLRRARAGHQVIFALPGVPRGT
jgi:hypothetical protein